MRTIILKDGAEVLVDDDDYEWLCEQALAFYWGKSRRIGRRSYVAQGRRGTFHEMHRAIMHHHGQKLTGKVVDHRNGNGLDNRKANLRVVTQRENVRNQRPQINPNKKSRFKGVSRHVNKRTGYEAWVARINIPECLTLGYFQSEADAAYAYNKAAVRYFGDCANLNRL